MTRQELGITHILEVSPRGFANEVTVLPITQEYVARAEEIKTHYAEDPNGSAWLYAWDDAPAPLRSQVGIILRETRTAEALDNLLNAALLPAFSVDPNAYDFTGGQWVTALRK